MAHDVFLSYSSKNKTIANAVCAKLEESGIRVWIAPRDVPVGTNFAESIVDAIDDCKVLVLVWSADANVSKHVLNEISQAFDKGIPIIPFRIQDVMPTRAMSYYISSTHWLDAIDPPLEKHIGKLKKSIRAILRDKAPDEAPISPPVDGVQRDLSAPPELQQPQDAARSRNRWRRLMPFFAVGGIGVVLVLAFFSGFFGNSPASGVADLFSSDTPTATSTPRTPRATVTPWPSSTPRPTPTLTPVPDWVEAYADPILAAIQDQAPVVQDDFSELDPRWNYEAYPWHDPNGLCPEPASELMQVEDSSLILTLSPDCPNSNLFLGDSPDLQNFVWQAELNLQSTTGNVELQSAYPGNSGLSFTIRRGVWQFLLIEGDQTADMARGGLPVNASSTPFTVTIINQCPYYLVYVNSDLLVARNALEVCQQWGGNHINHWNEEEMDQPEFLAIDSITFWELEPIE